MKKMHQSEAFMVRYQASEQMRAASARFLSCALAKLRARANSSILIPRRSVLTAWLLILTLVCQTIVPMATAAERNTLRKQPVTPSRDVKTPKAQNKLEVPLAQTSETITVFGPRRFDRVGLLTTITEQFSLPADAIAPFTVQVRNGAPDGAGRALFGTIRLNGSVLFSPGELNQQASTLTQTDTLSASNSLEVQFLSRRSSFLTITITATRGPARPPVINDFNPKRGPAGTSIEITGANFVLSSGTGPQVTINKQGGGTLAAPVTSFGLNNISFTIPTGAVSGPLIVTVAGQSATSTATLDIVASNDFTLTAAPNTADVIQGQSVSYAITLASRNGFSQLATLSVTGLPSGITGSFKPQQVTAGQTSVLTVTAPIAQPPSTAALTVSASAIVDGIALNQSANVSLNIKPITTSFLGRTVVADTLETPLAGVTVKFLGKDGNGNPTNCFAQTVSDAAGNFGFTNLPAGCAGEQLIRYDGLTATSPPGRYAGVDLVYNLVSNQVTVSPVLVHLPRIDDKETVMVQQNAPTDQTFQFSSIPGLSVTVYAGTTFTLVDGTQPNPFPLTAIQVPVDRLPDAKPPNPQMMMVFIVAFQPANATASQPVPVYFPNTINTPPGTNMVLMTLDPTRGTMVPYGTGTVSNDGVQVVPDFNPATPGKRFGLVHFDWHGGMPPPGPAVNPCPEGACCAGMGNSIDLSSGLEVRTESDIAISGLRGGISIQRIYRTLSTEAGPFGIGTGHNYSYRLDTFNPQASAIINLIMPDGNRFPFARGTALTLFNGTIPRVRGARITVLSNNQVELRWKDGTVFHFVPANFQLGSVLQSITDPNGNKVTLLRNASAPAQITQVIDPVGRMLILSYDAADRITSITDPIGRTVTYTYNAQGTMATMTDPEGGVTRYDYDAQNRLVQVTDARGIVESRLTYGDFGRVIEEAQADGGRLQFAYTFINPLAPTSPVAQNVVTDARGNRTTYRFNTLGFLVDVTDAFGQTRVFEREPGTNLLLAIKGTGSCNVCGTSGAGDQSFTYDGNGNVLSRTNALGNVTRFAYEPVFNRVTSLTDPIGNVTQFAYDSRGNLIQITDANDNQTSLAYDSAGLVTAITDPLNNQARLSYDNLGNPVTITDPMGKSIAMIYDGVSRLIEVKDRLGRRSRAVYDNLDRVLSYVDARGQTTSFTYDAVSNLLSLTDARGKSISFSYDSLNRPVTRTTPGGRTDTRRYDLNGNLVEFTDRRGQTLLFEYDALDRLTREMYQDGSSVLRQYDPRGRLLQADDSLGGVFNFAYDLAGRQLRVAGPFGTVLYTRDARGRVISRQVVGQPAVTHTYDRVGNLLTANSPQAAMSFTYDARNQLVGAMRSNGVSSSYSYDSLGRLLSIAHSRGAAVLNSQTYTYDAVGNRTSYGTNIAQSLITQPFTATYDNENRLLTRGSITYAYDENGNRISESGPGGATTYTWDSRNRLQSMTLPGGQSATFRYDFAGNMIENQLANAGANSTERFVLDNLTNVISMSDTGGQQLSVLTGRSIDSHLAVVRPGGQVDFGLDDAINSTVATTNESGAQNSQFFYEPYGETTSSGVSFRFQFTGRVPVQGGLYYYRARFYDPNAGRFLSEDPITYAGGVNQYAYVHGNPTNRRDPFGLQQFIGPVPENLDEVEQKIIADLNKEYSDFQQQLDDGPQSTWFAGFVSRPIKIAGEASKNLFCATSQDEIDRVLQQRDRELGIELSFDVLSGTLSVGYSAAAREIGRANVWAGQSIRWLPLLRDWLLGKFKNRK
jgi:RHS repeat-associated protein